MQGLANVLLSMQPEGDLVFLRDWQREVVAAARKVPGFMDSEEFVQVPGVQDRWILVLRFSSEEGLRQWLESDQRRLLMEKGSALSPRQEVVTGPGSSARPVTIVVSTAVRPDQVDEFLAWQEEIKVLESQSPGFIDRRMVEPAAGHDWTIVMRFDSKENADAWIGSPQRAAMMRKIDAALRGDAPKLLLDFGGWFEAAPDTGGRPAAWKQMLSVLMAIYPIVMLTMIFVDPIPQIKLPLALAVLRDNLLSCCLLTWLVMPRLTQALGFWLQPQRGQPGWWEKAGTLLVLLIILLELALFEVLR